MGDIAKLNVCCADMQSMLESANIAEHSANALNSMKDKKQYADFLDLVESFGESMAFIDHDELSNLLLKAWSVYMDVVNNERKAQKKKVQSIQEDKKADPDLLAKNEDILEQVNQRRAMAVASVVRFKAMTAISIKEFRKNPQLDALAMYDDKK